MRKLFCLRERLDQAVLVAVSGYGQPADRQRSREAGFDAHRVKPVQFDVLKPLLAEHGDRL